ncbi:zinc ribbon domain-containing protein [Methanoculleus chikugoensis]|nr:zinc ribbon domain-containing protein [Methanoculleus chikugoensis]
MPPLARDEDAGTEADGSLSVKYCTYCYRDGGGSLSLS